jgi:hypothetical protein
MVLCWRKKRMAEIQPGPELDAIMAKLCEWEDHGDWWLTDRGYILKSGWTPSTDATLALRDVVPAMAKWEWWPSCGIGDGGAGVTFYHDRRNCVYSEYNHPDASQALAGALCLAARKAMEEE